MFIRAFAEVTQGPTSVMGKYYAKGNRSQLGKPAGSNERARKATWVQPKKGRRA